MAESASNVSRSLAASVQRLRARVGAVATWSYAVHALAPVVAERGAVRTWALDWCLAGFELRSFLMVREYVPPEVHAEFTMATEALKGFEFAMAWGFGFAGLTPSEDAAIEVAHARAGRVVVDLLAAYRRCELTHTELSERLQTATDPVTLFAEAGLVERG